MDRLRYNNDPRCLSTAPTLDAFLQRLGQVLSCGANALTPDGKLAVLIGGFSDYDQGRSRYIPLPALTYQVAADVGLRPACTEIIRLQHGNTSSRKRYRSTFIPGLHDTCIIFERE